MTNHFDCCRPPGFIAHVDHGKSSLSSRLLELCGNLGPEAQKDAWKAATGKAVETGTISAENREKIEALDTLSVEQQRGITVKASTATMLYKHPSAVGPTGTLLLNMYDTPGHVDFGKEVSRSLCFVQGAVLLLDAAQGIQAQTWSVHEKAKAMEEPPELIMALTKCDLELARPDNCKKMTDNKCTLLKVGGGTHNYTLSLDPQAPLPFANGWSWMILMLFFKPVLAVEWGYCL